MHGRTDMRWRCRGSRFRIRPGRSGGERGAEPDFLGGFRARCRTNGPISHDGCRTPARRTLEGIVVAALLRWTIGARRRSDHRVRFKVAATKSNAGALRRDAGQDVRLVDPAIGVRRIRVGASAGRGRHGEAIPGLETLTDP